MNKNWTLIVKQGKQSVVGNYFLDNMTPDTIAVLSKTNATSKKKNSTVLPNPNLEELWKI